MAGGARDWCKQINRVEDRITALKARQQRLLDKRPSRTQRNKEFGWSIVRL